MAAIRGEFKINVTGLEETLKALKQYDPAARKALYQAIAKSGRLIRNDARKRVPSLHVARGWREQKDWPDRSGTWERRRLTRGNKGWPPWNPDNVKKFINSYMKASKASKGSIITSRGIVANSSAEGVIYEFAKYSNESKNYPWVNSIPFVNALGTMRGGRLIWSSAERLRHQWEPMIINGMDEANAKLQAHLDSIRGGKP